MEVMTTSSNREIILRILINKTGEKAEYSYAPEFTYTVGGYTFKRNGIITFESDYANVFSDLASLGLCDQNPETPEADLSESLSENSNHIQFTYPMNEFTGKTLLNLVGIFSARQRLINQAIGVKVFRLDTEFVKELYYHPPVTRNDFLISIYGKETMYTGLTFNREYISLSEFNKAKDTNPSVLKQLADAIVAASFRLDWTKPFTRNVRNRKHAMHTWLTEIGMIGPEYEETRSVLLNRLYGKSDRKKL